ncbi:MAG: hypothetical protein IPK07_31375 [Deltaproteobacteria bacterium]|nr:hypothetical protein [Deltaproteobacteria bacterium]
MTRTVCGARSTGVARWAAVGLLVLAALGPPCTARAAEAAGSPTEEGWTVDVIPYLWALSMTGTAGVAGVEADLDMSFGDILNDLNIALMGAVEARNGRWGFTVNPLYSRLSDEPKATVLGQPASLDVTLDLFVLQFGLNYRLGPFPLGRCGGGPELSILPQIGGRYTYLDTDVELDFLSSRGGSLTKDWVDPLVGLRGVLDLTPAWSLTVAGDVGGFDVGTQLAWSATGYVGYRWDLTDSVTGSVLLGYRALYQDYETGDGLEEFVFDTTMHGPVIGFDFGF